MHYIFSRADRAAKIRRNLSQQQKEVIANTIGANIEAFKSSETADAMLHDAKLFGIDVVLEAEEEIE